MSEFNMDAWMEQTSRIPHQHIGDALRAVVDRKKVIDQEPQIRAQENETARQYHQAVAPTVKMVDGVPVWVKPVADFAAYPPGTHVHHQGGVWEQVSDRITHEEPGTGPTWAPPAPDPETIPEEGQANE